jgi:hypothetical protein
MGLLKGQIISGVFDQTVNTFSVKKIKQFSTQTVLNKKQTSSLYYYLKSHLEDEDGQIVTLYDQMPVKLSQPEVGRLVEDLERIRQMYE